MALSYLQEAQINAGLLASQKFEMKQENDTRRTALNNNAAVALFPRMSAAAAAAAGLSMLTPQQLLAASHTAALMAAGIPVSLHASLAAANPSLYAQNLFNNWQPPATITSPPSPLQAPVSPALSNKSNSRARTNNNNNNHNNNNNNNMVSSSMDRLKKGMPAGQGKKRGPKSKTDLTSPTMSEGAAPLSPAISISPEATSSSGKDKVFTCRTCSRSFGYKHVLQNHERTHTGEKPFECPECHKRFTRDHHLKTHMRLHTGEKPYHCSHCDRQFVQVANLRRHLRVHTGERPYACELCSQKFSDSNQLKAHVLIHKGEKPFQCEHCQTRFRRRHHMLHHKCGTTSARVASPSITSDDLEDDIDVDIDGDDDNKQTNINARRPITHRPMQSPIMETAQMPLNLSSNVSIDMPEQTEPEDLSMHRPSSHSHSSGDSPLSRSPSSDIVHEDEEEELNVSEASPSTLFLQRHHDEYRIHLANLAKNGSNAS